MNNLDQFLAEAKRLGITHMPQVNLADAQKCIDYLLAENTRLKAELSAPVYLAQYNDMIHESAYATLSVHRSGVTAKAVVDAHQKKIARIQGKECYPWQAWKVLKLKVKP